MDVAELVGDILKHHGVKGQKWGVRRKATVSAQEVIVSDRRKKLKTKGGGGHPASADAVRARTLGQISKKSGVKALSDKEIQDYTRRLQLEQSVKRLQYNEANPGKKFVLSLLGQTGKNQASQLADQAASAAVKKGIAKAAMLAAAA